MIDHLMDLRDRITKLRLARAVMGDDWLKTELNIDIGELDRLEAEYREGLQKLKEAASRCACDL